MDLQELANATAAFLLGKTDTLPADMESQRASLIATRGRIREQATGPLARLEAHYADEDARR